MTLEDATLHAVYLSDDKGCGGSSQRLAYLLKRLLLSHSNSDGAAIQTATVQSIVLLLKGPLTSSFSVTVLKADIAGAAIVNDIPSVICRNLLWCSGVFSILSRVRVSHSPSVSPLFLPSLTFPFLPSFLFPFAHIPSLSFLFFPRSLG